MTETPRYPSGSGPSDEASRQRGASPLGGTGEETPPASGGYFPPPPAGDGLGGTGYGPPPVGDGAAYGPPHYGATSSPGYDPPGQAGAAPGGYGPMSPTSYGPPAGALSPGDERTWGMLAHLSAFAAAIVALSPLGPLLVMLIQGPKSAFVRQQAVEALNFQLTTYILGAISFVLAFVLIGFVTGAAVFIGWIVFTIVASVAANRGENYRYPINFRLVK